MQVSGKARSRVAEKYILVLCTVPTSEAGLEIAEGLVENEAAACVNIVPGVNSIYKWEGKICRDQELILLIKSRESLFEKLEKLIISLHPYDVPEIVSVEISEGNQAYLEWISGVTSG